MSREYMELEDIEEEMLQYECSEIEHNIRTGKGYIVEINGVEEYMEY